MLAFRLPVSVAYHWPTILAALLVAILASAVALYVASGQKMGLVEALTGSVFMGAGIAGLHYIGIAAMRLPAITQYSLVRLTCSILLAILFSLIALLMAFGLREETKWTVPRRLGTAVVMGAAVSAMHYTGMAAASVFPIRVPPLRERSGDIPILVRCFVRKYALRMARNIETIPSETMKALVSWQWPGNVRELENVVERSVILTEGKTLRVPLAELVEERQNADPENHTLERAEREHILRVLRECIGLVSGPTGAAHRLGLKRSTLQSKMLRLGITRDDYSGPPRE
jgi:NO-binding membrane sensor protein with MHYT domain